MIKITNERMKSLWLKSNLLFDTKTSKLDVLQIIKDLGFVQLDTIQNVTRAHHHILWSRNKNYKEHMLDDLLLEKGSVFEHFTHDASILPIESYSMWKIQFSRIKEKHDKSKYYSNILPKEEIEIILNRFKNEGPLHIKDFDSQNVKDKKTWSRSIHKTTLDYLWYNGILSTAYRQSFRKYYDLTSNIIPSKVLNKEIKTQEQINWLCFEALDKLCIANAKEIKDFWQVLTIKEVNTWLKNNKENITEVLWENNEGKYIKSFASKDIENRLATLKKSSNTMKIINPFDPAIRNRIRLKTIFNFDYKIEIFVPKEKRQWGYYVYPVLLGNNFVARIELQVNRKTKELFVINFWKEEGSSWGKDEDLKLERELTSFANLIGISKIVF